MLVSVGLASLGAVAWAQDEADLLQLRVSRQLTRDSNLFRLPAASQRQALPEADGADETMTADRFGLILKKSWSLQHLELEVAWVDYRYRRFRYLDFAAHDHRLDWRWRLTPALYGSLVDQRTQTPTDFADWQNDSQRNVLSNHSTRLDAAYAVDGAWSGLAGVALAEQTSELPLAAEGDLRTRAVELGLQYAPASGSQASWRTRRTHGNPVGHGLVSTAPQSQHFSQQEHEWRLRWNVASKTRADVRLTDTQREYSDLAQRNFGGLNGGIGIGWEVTARVFVATSWSRERASYQSSDANYTLTDRVLLEPVWQIGDQSVLRLRLERASRAYLGAAEPPSEGARRDVLSDLTLVFDWQPVRFVTLNASLRSLVRSSNRSGLDYRANLFGLSAQYAY